MGRYVEGESRDQSVLFPERLGDWVAEDSMVRVIDVFVEELELSQLGFEQIMPQHAAGVHLPVPRKSLAAPALHPTIGQGAIEEEERRAGVELFLGGKWALRRHGYS